MPISSEVARARGRVAGYKRAIKNGERAADHTVAEAERDLAVAVLADHAKKVVAAWPELTAEQLGRIAGILRSGAA